MNVRKCAMIVPKTLVLRPLHRQVGWHLVCLSVAPLPAAPWTSAPDAIPPAGRPLIFFWCLCGDSSNSNSNGAMRNQTAFNMRSAAQSSVVVSFAMMLPRRHSYDHRRVGLLACVATANPTGGWDSLCCVGASVRRRQRQRQQHQQHQQPSASNVCLVVHSSGVCCLSRVRPSSH